MKKVFKSAPVLLVDDDEVVRIMGSAILSKMGANVLTASNMKEAIEMVDDQDFHYLLLDVNLPCHTKEAKEELKEKIHQDTKMIGMVSINQHNVVRRQNLDDLHLILEKPLDLEKMKKAVGF